MTDQFLSYFYPRELFANALQETASVQSNSFPIRKNTRNNLSDLLQ